MSESLEQKIAKLLALAERAGTPEEAESASRMAERLMTKWGIEEAVIRQRMGAGQKPESIVTKTMGPFPKTFVKPRTAVACAVVNGMGNMRPFLRTHPDGSVSVAIVGFESDVDRAITLANSIVVQADNAVAMWWKTYPLRSALSASEAKNAKRQFLFSFGLAVQMRLKEMRVEEINNSAVSEPGTAVALIDRGKMVDAEFSKLRLRKGRGVKGSAHGSAEGHAAGKRAVLGGPSIGGARGALGR